MEKDMMSAAEGVNADQEFDTLEQWLQIFQDTAKKLGVLEQLPQIVQNAAENLNLYKNLEGVIGNAIKDFDVCNFLDVQCIFLITLIRHKSEFREGLIDDDVIKLAIDIAYKACLVAGFEAGIIIQEKKDLYKFKEIEMYVNTIKDAFCSLDEYISKSYKENELYEAIQNSVDKFNLKNILDPENLKYYNFYRDFLMLSKTTESVFLATRIIFAIGFMAGYAQSQDRSQYWLQESARGL
jgi:hypothetical protein